MNFKPNIFYFYIFSLFITYNNCSVNNQAYSIQENLPNEILELIIGYSLYNDNDKNNNQYTSKSYKINIFSLLNKLKKNISENINYFFNFNHIKITNSDKELIQFAENIYNTHKKLSLVCKKFKINSKSSIADIYHHLNKITNNRLIFLAVRFNNKYLFNVLAKRNFDANIQNEDNDTLLIWSVIYNNLYFVEKLINLNANLNLKNNLGLCALIYAIKYYYTDIAKLLIENEADVNTYDNYGNSPLIYAISQNLEYLSNILIEQGADTNHQNKFGISYWLLKKYINNERHSYNSFFLHLHDNDYLDVYL